MVQNCKVNSVDAHLTHDAYLIVKFDSMSVAGINKKLIDFTNFHEVRPYLYVNYLL